MAPPPEVRYPSAKNVGLAIRMKKNGKHIDKEYDEESAGVVADIIPIGVSLGVRRH